MATSVDSVRWWTWVCNEQRKEGGEKSERRKMKIGKRT